jgi:nicotinic acid mononucleotide adenylyltransferase
MQRPGGPGGTASGGHLSTAAKIDLAVEQLDLTETIDRAVISAEPEIHFVSRPGQPGRRLGVFSSSFNPLTTAHVELMNRALREFALDEILALAGTSNADKTSYDCPLRHRLEMLRAATAECKYVSVGISSTGYFVDMIAAIFRAYPPDTDLHFIVGMDTFVRVVDQEGRYVDRYQTSFRDRRDALSFLLAHSRLIVAERTYTGRPDPADLILKNPEIRASRILPMDFPRDLSERSASEVRRMLQAGLSVSDLVPIEVEGHIREHGLYSASADEDQGP